MKKHFNVFLIIGLFGLILIMGCTNSNRGSNSGDLLSTFGTNGIVIDNGAAGGNSDDGGRAIAVLADKIYVAGYSNNGDANVLAIWSFNSDGTKNTSFGDNGKVIYDSKESNIWPKIDIDSDGNIYVLAPSYDNDLDIIILKFDRNGNFDSNFGSNGVVTWDGGNGDDVGYNFYISENNIFIVGISKNASGNFDLIILSLNKINGNIVTTITWNSDYNLNDYGFDIWVEPDGNILVCGAVEISKDNYSTLLLKFTANGYLDTSFGNNGQVVVDGYAFRGVMAINEDGEIFLTGGFENDDGYDMIMMKFREDGSLSSNFGNNGILVIDKLVAKSDVDYGEDIVIDSNGKILITGEGTSDDGKIVMVVLKLNSDGTRYASFGNNGIAIFSYSSVTDGKDYGRAIAIDANGYIIVTGETYNGTDYDLILWKIMP